MVKSGRRPRGQRGRRVKRGRSAPHPGRRARGPALPLGEQLGRAAVLVALVLLFGILLGLIAWGALFSSQGPLWLVRPAPTATPRAAPPPASPTPVRSPTPSPTGQGLAAAVSAFTAAPSVQFDIAGTYAFTSTGQLFTVELSGRGALVRPDKFKSVLTGQYDSFFGFYKVGRSLRCQSPKGTFDPPECTPAFGAPGKGGSPYLAVLYLQNPTAVRDLGIETAGGRRLRHFGFKPDTARVAAQEPGIGPIFDRLDIAAEVWVDPASNLPQRLDIRVHQPGQEGTEVWTMSLTFRDYGQPVQVTLPSP